jgi:hypothetical protein
MLFVSLATALCFPGLHWRSQSILMLNRGMSLILSCSENDMPSDTSENWTDPLIPRSSELEMTLEILASESQRGQTSDSSMINAVLQAIDQIESDSNDNDGNGDIDQRLLLGKWVLIFANDDITRSSPFFWAFRQAFDGIKDPNPCRSNRNFADSIFQVTDMIPFKDVGEAYQTFTDASELISEIDVEVQFAGSTIMTTRSDYKVLANDQLEVSVKTTRAVQSTIGQILPGLNGDFEFPSGAALELKSPGSSTVLGRVTYLSDSLRVTRIADKVFVFKRC